MKRDLHNESGKLLEMGIFKIMSPETKYEKLAFSAMKSWQKKMKTKPSFFNKMSKRFQNRINRWIPEKVHLFITSAIKETTKAMISGAGLITPAPMKNESLEIREIKVLKQISFYKKTSAIEGAATGAGGILLGFADFPLWLSIKMKLLLEIASLYGYDVKNSSERLFILYIFQLSFSSQENRNEVYNKIENWNETPVSLTPDLNSMDWRKFQQEYRDYIDLAKFFQLVPGIGAVVGAYVNHTLTEQLGKTAMNAYRMRYFN
jgi:uncharacterized protein (DUF697 family)